MNFLIKRVIKLRFKSINNDVFNCDYLPHFQKRKYSSKYIPFNVEVDKRRLQAKKSIVVQVQSHKSSNDLFNYCSNFGAISKMYHYTNSTELLHFILVEFDNVESVKAILSSGSYVNNDEVIPVQSQFLWFRSTTTTPKNVNDNKSMSHLAGKNASHIPNVFQIEKSLSSCNTISEQMENLYSLTKLNDLGIRLRFLAANQLEVAISNMFPYATASPFGSSVNTFGKLGCDLDLILSFDNRINKFKENGRLMFHVKSGFGDERMQSQRFLDGVGDILQLFLPGCTNVRKILQARVPILKYTHSFANFECDISIKNLSGIVMSELLYVLSEVSPCTKPLVFTIRKWASEVGLTNPSPGRWLSNFSITILVLAFLQRLEPNPILPTINAILRHIDSKENGFNNEDLSRGRSFLSSIKTLPKMRRNSKTLETLLIDFLTYYANFDFGKYAISLYDGANITKPDHSPLYIINPLEQHLNVSKNVSIEELEKFKQHCRNALWIFETKSNDGVDCDVGLLKLIKSRSNNVKTGKLLSLSKPQQRLMEVTNIFEDNHVENKV